MTLVIAHRGASRLAPENTLAAFAAAVAERADMIEFDYRHSADGIPVVIHDDTLNRTTNARDVFGGERSPVAAHRLAELRRLDAGSWFAPQFAGTPLPTLDEALDVIHPGSVPLIERKAGDAATLVELLRRKKLLDRAIVESFDWPFVAECHRLAPELALAALGDGPLTSEKLNAAAHTGASTIAWNQDRLGPAEIEAIHRRGWRAFAYTVNDPQRAQALLAAGIDGLMTDILPANWQG